VSGRGTNGGSGRSRAGQNVWFGLVFGVALGIAGFLAAGAVARPSAAASCAATGHTIALCPTRLGRVLVDSKGHTLYLFKRDKHGKSMCYRSCAKYWPALLKHGKPTLGVGVKKSLLGTTRRRNGTRQLIYNRHPLYTYKLDTGVGQTNGEAVNAFGARWYAVSRKGNAVKPRPGGTTSTTTTTTTNCTSPPCY